MGRVGRVVQQAVDLSQKVGGSTANALRSVSEAAIRLPFQAGKSAATFIQTSLTKAFGLNAEQGKIAQPAALGTLKNGFEKTEASTKKEKADTNEAKEPKDLAKEIKANSKAFESFLGRQVKGWDLSGVQAQAVLAKAVALNNKSSQTDIDEVKHFYDLFLAEKSKRAI